MLSATLMFYLTEDSLTMVEHMKSLFRPLLLSVVSGKSHMRMHTHNIHNVHTCTHTYSYSCTTKRAHGHNTHIHAYT